MKTKSNLEIKIKKDADTNKLIFYFDLEKLSEKEFEHLFELIGYKFNVILKTFQQDKIEDSLTKVTKACEEECST